MRKKLFVTCLTATMICGMLTACGTKTETTEEEPTTVVTEAEAPTEEVIYVTTEGDATTTDSDATSTDVEEVTDESTDEVNYSDAEGNVNLFETDNDISVQITAKVFPETWYVDGNYAKSGKIFLYNVPTKEDAYSNSPRISIEMKDQDSIDYYNESKENVNNIDSITINEKEYTGTTYTQYGMEWTEYQTPVDDTGEFILIRISDVDVTTGEGADVLNSINFLTSSVMQGEE